MDEPRTPGDYLLDRYFKGADPETRERARDAFLEFGRVMEQLGERLMEEADDSRESPA